MVTFSIKAIWNCENLKEICDWFFCFFIFFLFFIFLFTDMCRRHCPWIVFIQNYFAFSVIAISHLTSSWSFIDVFWLNRCVNSRCVLTSHLLVQLIETQRRDSYGCSKQEENVFYQSYWASLFSGNVLSRMYFLWAVISNNICSNDFNLGAT